MKGCDARLTCIRVRPGATSKAILMKLNLDWRGTTGRATALTPLIARSVLIRSARRGPSLAEVLRDGVLPLGVMRTIGVDAAAALDRLQRRGIVHRGVTAANILIAPDGRARLGPAQAGGRGATAASAIHALGLILLESVAGQGSAPPARRPADLPASLAVLLTQMLADDAADRPSAAEVRSRLSALDLREAPLAHPAPPRDGAGG